MVQTTPTIFTAEAILILRVYVVYERKKWVFVLLSLLWLAHIGASCSILVVHEVRLVDLMNMSYSLNLRLGLSFFLPPLIFDTVVAGFLTVGLYAKYRRLILNMSLARFIIRDGLLYFFAVLGCNIIWFIAGFILYKSESRSMGFGPMYTLSSAITTTMIGRLTLSIRAHHSNGDDELSFNSISLRFARSAHSESTSLGVSGGA
ncbi:hypothetical protein BDZ94DRAFT_949884 [Collybia nuda]|uniref:Uncharacterized protein n=1 Tax=Collybia nuda TaxID=64659 RepID=A0A9P5Y0I1_9AGAR|nr:hypothetical protein BDZ94DRAFT_949884 [Collybia nuda]